jgi:autoinducer 2-degrading protein
MLVVIVSIVVKRDDVAAFKLATIANATASVKEPGVARFDLLQDQADPTRFALIEVYRNESAPAEHKETSHYKAWRDAVAPMMAGPRSSTKFDSVFPEGSAL